MWAALWLFEATSDDHYLDYAIQNAQSLGGTGWAMTEFSWDVKYAGLQVLASKVIYSHTQTSILYSTSHFVTFILISFLYVYKGFLKFPP